jgi:uncharacterized protein YecT (DUF1311 family)
MIALLMLFAAQNPNFVCNRGGSEHELRICAHDDYVAADRKLNVQWRKTIMAVKRDGIETKDIREKMLGLGSPDESLIAAQRAWIVFREQSCLTEERISAGSVHTRRYFECMEAMTKERTSQLFKLSRNPEHPEDPL